MCMYICICVILHTGDKYVLLQSSLFYFFLFFPRVCLWQYCCADICSGRSVWNELYQWISIFFLHVFRRSGWSIFITVNYVVKYKNKWPLSLELAGRSLQRSRHGQRAIWISHNPSQATDPCVTVQLISWTKILFCVRQQRDNHYNTLLVSIIAIKSEYKILL